MRRQDQLVKGGKVDQANASLGLPALNAGTLVFAQKDLVFVMLTQQSVSLTCAMPPTVYILLLAHAEMEKAYKIAHAKL